MDKIFVFVVLLAQCFIVNAQQALPFGVQVALDSKVLKQPQTLHIYTPTDYDQAANHIRYPVIYTLDGWLLSHSVSGIVGHLGNTAAMPKAIVVAIHSNNEFDYSPSLYASNSGWGKDPNQRLSGFAGGQADTYLEFIQSELIPYIDSNYRSNDFRILIGMSPTAAFTLHTLWKAPSLFDGHFVFAATDVLGMGYTPQTTFIDKFAESLAKDPDRKGYLYIASAKRETDNKPQRNQNIAALKKALAPYKNFKVRAEHIDNFGHYPVALPGLMSALDLVFPREKWEAKGLFRTLTQKPGNALGNIKAYYQELSKDVGFTAYPNADLRRNATCYRVIANQLGGQKRFTEVKEIYQQWLKDYPNSAKAIAGLKRVEAAMSKAKPDA